MTAKDFLMQYHDTAVEIRTLTEEKLRLRSLSEKVTMAFDNDGSAAGTPSNDKMQRCVEKLIEIDEKIANRLADLGDIRSKVYDVIQGVPDSRLRTVLMMRYINDKSFEYIASSIGYTYNHLIREIHPSALAEVEKILNSPLNPIDSH